MLDTLCTYGCACLYEQCAISKCEQRYSCREYNRLESKGSDKNMSTVNVFDVHDFDHFVNDADVLKQSRRAIRISSLSISSPVSLLLPLVG